MVNSGGSGELWAGATKIWSAPPDAKMLTLSALISPLRILLCSRQKHEAFSSLNMHVLLLALKMSLPLLRAYSLQYICISVSNNSYSLLRHPNAAAISQVVTVRERWIRGGK